MKAQAISQRASLKNDWQLSRLGALTITQSPLLSSVRGLVHAFTTRLGGQSAEPRQWYNLERGKEKNDVRADAESNRLHLCQRLDLDASRLLVPGQMHTTNVYVLAPGERPTETLADTDGVATSEHGTPLLLLFADCTPVILLDPQKKILCVIHAGWRGTAGGIVKNGIETMKKHFGCRPADILAAVGPAIGSCCYETGSDVAQKLIASVANSQGLIIDKNGRPHPDLKAINTMQLLEAGVEEIDTTAWCTACHPEIFYSHRGSGGNTGRQGAIAALAY